MINDNYVLMYCNGIIATFNTLEEAIEYKQECLKSGLYYKDNEHPFNIYVKIYY